MLYSTSESAEQGEISALAIVETLVAMSLTIWIAVRYQTVVHVAISGCIAPFLLLRTQASTKLALSWFEESGIGDRVFMSAMRLFQRLGGLKEQNSLLKNFRWTLTIPIHTPSFLACVASLQVARVAATVFAMVSEPTTALRAVAANWRRVALATDVCCSPEVLPGIETNACSGILSVLRFRVWMKSTREDLNWKKPVSFFRCCVFSPGAFALFYLPSILYRLSLKSTSLLYMPFMFVIRSHIGEDLSAKERIHDIKFGATEQLQWHYAVIVVIANSAALLALFANIAVLNNAIESGGPMIALLCDLFLPTNGQQLTLKAWHIARFANAAIVIGLLLYADKAERRLDSGRWTENEVTTTFEIVRQVQLVLALYTTFCALSRFIQFALDAKLPPVGFEFLP